MYTEKQKTYPGLTIFCRGCVYGACACLDTSRRPSADGAADAAPSPSALRASGAETSTRPCNLTDRPPRHPRADARGRRDKHTPCNLTDRLKTRSRGRAAPLNRLGRALPVFALDRVFIAMVVSGEGQLLLGICAMVSLLTVPIYSPSFRHVKVSVSSSFLSSTTMRQMMS